MPETHSSWVDVWNNSAIFFRFNAIYKPGSFSESILLRMSIPYLLPLTVSIMFMGVSSACSPHSVYSNLQIYRPSYFKIRECGQRPLYQDIRRRKRVTNGDQAALGQWPWHVKIKRAGPPCSGVLIDSDWVLTAAHCLYNKYSRRKFENPANVTVTAGTLSIHANDSTRTAEVRRVSEIYMHPKHAAEVSLNNYDFMILKLSEPFYLNEFIQTACIQMKDDLFEPGIAECYAAGWGQYYRSSRMHMSPTLRYSRVPILSRPECNDYAGNVSKNQLSMVTDQKMCAGVWNKTFYGPCQGDSGGPLVCFEKTSRSWYVTGVVSHGPKCGEVGFYTKVHAMVDFIEEVVFGTFNNEEYTCLNGEGKVPVERKCDGYPDCSDLSDETVCECTEAQFRCNNGICRVSADLCNGKDDCGDNSDEIECEYFHCEIDGTNIGYEQVCDGIRNCPDWSDEHPSVCECDPSNHFQCATGPCIPLTWRCDGQDDCISKDDESNCSRACRDGYFACNNGRCTQNVTVCNGQDDCGDSSDEIGCACDEGSFMCDLLGICISDEVFPCDRKRLETICSSDDQSQLLNCSGDSSS